MTEQNIIHESTNMYLSNAGGVLRIWLNGATHAVLVGESPCIDKAKQTMRRLELYPKELRRFHNHY